MDAHLGQVGVDVETPFALSSVELWLDDRQIASGSMSSQLKRPDRDGLHQRNRSIERHQAARAGWGGQT
jgi:hypothetical protein